MNKYHRISVNIILKILKKINKTQEIQVGWNKKQWIVMMSGKEGITHVSWPLSRCMAAMRPPQGRQESDWCPISGCAWTSLAGFAVDRIELFNHNDLGQMVIKWNVLFFTLNNSTEAEFLFSSWKCVKLQVLVHYFGIDRA